MDVLPAAASPATIVSVGFVSTVGKSTLHVADNVGAVCTQDHKNDNFAPVADTPKRGVNKINSFSFSSA